MSKSGYLTRDLTTLSLLFLEHPPHWLTRNLILQPATSHPTRHTCHTFIVSYTQGQDLYFCQRFIFCVHVARFICCVHIAKENRMDGGGGRFGDLANWILKSSKMHSWTQKNLYLWAIKDGIFFSKRAQKSIGSCFASVRGTLITRFWICLWYIFF